MVSWGAGNHQEQVALRTGEARSSGGRKDPAISEKTAAMEGREDLQDPNNRTPATRCKRKNLGTKCDEQQEAASTVAIRPFDDPNFSWTTLQDIDRAQEQFRNTMPSKFLAVSGSRKGWYHKGKMWILAKDTSLLQRLMIVAHCGAHGHRRRAAMMEHLSRHFYVDHLRGHIDKFQAACFLGILVSWKGLERIEDSWEPMQSLWKDIRVMPPETYTTKNMIFNHFKLK
ncbi:hypothetical protein PHMEG_0009145 [Phytophthora megakarya]|uniref:Uncharacterized protein n=1 Tax=Phytophthora megakarya TaxID=4795 RepID=A0A225WHT0_9STRA|nr:hypothetical protein PHMEG_0009145 [Phytophthora megakarya]